MSSGIAFPRLNVNSFNVNATDPGNTRHVVSGSFAYRRLLGKNNCNLALDFGSITLNVLDIEAASDVVAVNFTFPNLTTLAAQSGVPTVVNNLRLWLPPASGTILDPPGISLQAVTSGSWVPFFAFPSGGGTELPSTIPDRQNVFRIDGHHSISGFAATEVSQYVYFRLFLDVDYPIGAFGVDCGSGILRPRVSYDFY
jgi:hypothetical protein